ncbi:phage regulatory CII family protein [Vibrio crassostreae]|uniref:phage regulatory CII family protein n=1 Tax=Vibrio crassostreae TaxID=246167 RepID=UPI0020A2FE2F|nr:phage regulatory CII family protein [Vibrio crassostreae]
MNVNVSMYIFRESKQKAFEDACNAFWLTENITEIAKNIGVSSAILRNQLNTEHPLETAFDEELDQLREHADQSCWKGFCELAFKVKRVIGINWLGTIIKPSSEEFSLVKKKDVKRRALGRALPWVQCSWLGLRFCPTFLQVSIRYE